MNEKCLKALRRVIKESQNDVTMSADNEEMLYNTGWVNGQMQIIHILEKYYGKILEEGEEE